MAQQALIIIDMLNDFVDGKLSNPNAQTITPSIQRLLAYARASEDWVVVYANDLHDPEDREMRIWGDHAMRGTEGAQVIPALAPQVGQQEWEEPKHFYGAFDGTNLAEKLHNIGVQNVYLTGQHTNCCLRHTAYGAFQNNFEIYVAEDGCALFRDDNQEDALDYLKNIYGATITNSEEICT